MVGSPHLQPAPSPSSDTCVHAVTRPTVAESASAFQFGEGGLEETVVDAVDQVKDLKPSFTCNFNTHQQLHSY